MTARTASRDVVSPSIRGNISTPNPDRFPTMLATAAGDSYRRAMGADVAWLSGTPPQRIVGRTVVLQRWRDDDLEPKLDAILSSIDELTSWMPWAPGYNRDVGADFLRRSQEEWDARTTFGYAIRSPDDEIVGSLGMHPRLGVGGLEIGYWVRSDVTGHGYATRGSALATAAALALDDVSYVEIRHDRANERSRRIPARLGYRHVETVEREPEAPRESGTALHWRMTAEEYPTSAAAGVVADETDASNAGQV
ncbi:MAG TPA: GNAT family N-acetyltransferase [Euzebyales bacterium]